MDDLVGWMLDWLADRGAAYLECWLLGLITGIMLVVIFSGSE